MSGQKECHHVSSDNSNKNDNTSTTTTTNSLYQWDSIMLRKENLAGS